MSRPSDLARLQTLAALVRDHRLSLLHEAATRCSQSRMQIAALDRDSKDPDLSVVAAGLVGLRYQAWADVRRGELNTVLARQTADWLAARDEARLAFGRAGALEAMLRRGAVQRGGGHRAG